MQIQNRADDGYGGANGPEHWADLDSNNFVCSGGTQQSPIDISGAVKADIPRIAIGWHKGGGTMVNNGHTIQINMPEGSTLSRGDDVYELVQFHFHAPSEHHVDGKTFSMEVHFVHKDTKSDALGVLGVFLTPGRANASFAGLAAAFPAREGEEVVVDDVDPNAPAGLARLLDLRGIPDNAALHRECRLDSGDGAG